MLKKLWTQILNFKTLQNNTTSQVSDASVLCDDYNHDLESEILTLSLDTPLTPDNTQNGFYIELEFTGPIIIAGQTTGLFAVDENSITANMKDGNAHKVAPCYEGVAIKTWLTVIGGEGSQVETNLVRISISSAH